MRAVSGALGELSIRSSLFAEGVTGGLGLVHHNVPVVEFDPLTDGAPFGGGSDSEVERVECR